MAAPRHCLPPALAFGLLAATAAVGHAQAPGEVAPQPVETVTSRPWAVALSLSAEGMSPDGGQSVGLGVFELAGRYRVRADIELGLSLGGGGGDSGRLSTGGLFADIRYHLHPEQPWHVVFLGSLGAASVYGKGAADVDRKGRGALRIGAGLERRWRAWAIEADLRVVSIAENKDVPVVYPTTTEYLVARYGVSGAALTFAGTFYW